MIKRPLSVVPGLALALSLAVAGLARPALAQTELKTDGDKAAYSLGYLIGQQVADQLKTLDLSDEERAIAVAAANEAMAGEEARTDVQAGLAILRTREEAKAAAALEEKKKKNEALLAQEAAAEGATKTESGLIHQTLTAGDGAAPTETDTVKVHYRGTLPDGFEFDSSYGRGEPAVFNLGQVIPCFRDGIQTMKVGGKSRLVCPPEIAYGESGAGQDIPPLAVLIFEVELLGVETPQPQ